MNPEAERQLLDRLKIQRDAIDALRRQQARDVRELAELRADAETLAEVREVMNGDISKSVHYKINKLRKILDDG